MSFLSGIVLVDPISEEHLRLTQLRPVHQHQKRQHQPQGASQLQLPRENKPKQMNNPQPILKEEIILLTKTKPCWNRQCESGCHRVSYSMTEMVNQEVSTNEQAKQRLDYSRLHQRTSLSKRIQIPIILQGGRLSRSLQFITEIRSQKIITILPW